jgi:beta-barrel assembly-enhancing protease
MYNPLAFLARSLRSWFYPLVSVLVALSLVLAVPRPGQAFSLWDILIQGVEYLQLASMSDEQEVQLGQQINQEITSQVPIFNNPQLTRYLNDIGQRLATKSDRTNIPYTFQVVADKSINAFATMGGFVYINAGLMVAADNEAQLAGVIGHEIGHIAGRHALEQMKQMALARGVASVTGLDTNTAVQIGVELALRLPMSREDEFDADRRGLTNLGRAGYAQSAMPAFMKKLVSSSSTPSFLNSHPATEDRIASMNQSLNPAQANQGDGLDSKAYKAKLKALLRA